MNEIIEIAKYTIPSIVVLGTTYILVKSFLENEYKKKLIEVRMNGQKIITPIRLQAYERYALLLERITPDSLAMRVMKTSMTAQQYQLEILNTIRTEFNHNIAQQIYISDEAWSLIKTAKEEMIKMVNICASKLPENATSKDLTKMMFEAIMVVEKLPTTVALDYLKNEIKTIF